MGIMSMMKSLMKKPEEAGRDDSCILLADGEELEVAVKIRDKLMVLFYASWCPFSQAFLPIYRAHAAAGDPCYVRILVDGGDHVAERYAIAVFPTVLFFEKGRLAKRLDGVYHRGLSQDQLEDFARRCAVK